MGLPIPLDVFVRAIVGLASDKHSYYDVLLLEVHQAKKPILLGSCSRVFSLCFAVFFPVLLIPCNSSPP